MELKTLKDIGFSHIIAEEDINKVTGKSTNAKVYVDFEEYTNELKQEAIKWIKEFKKKTFTPDYEMAIRCHSAYTTMMGFFNITEDDLK